MAEKHEGGDNRAFEQKRIAGVQKPRLFQHVPHPHVPHNVNLLHEAEKASSSLNDRIAIALTKGVGSMTCAYIFAVLALLGLPGLLPPVVAQWVQWISQTFIQLVMLSIIMVGTGLLGRHQELQSDEQFETTTKTYNDIGQIIEHLGKQDEELLKHTAILTAIAQMMSGEGTHGDSTK